MYEIIDQRSSCFPVMKLCQVMGVGATAFYDWRMCTAKRITEDTLRLYRTKKCLFEQSRNSLGSRDMIKRLSQEGLSIGRYRLQNLMKKLGLYVIQRLLHKVTTKRRVSGAVADDLLNQNFKPLGLKQVWAGDVMYLKPVKAGCTWLL